MRLRNPLFLMAIVCLASAATDRAHASDGVVGPGNCNEAGLVSVLNAVQGTGGGTITFNCGVAPLTIAISSYKQISATVTIDGAGLITLSGANTSAFFQVFVAGRLTLRRMTLTNGRFNAVAPLENFGMLVIDNSTIRDNQSSEGTISNNASLVVMSSTFMNNQVASGISRAGGAIRNNGGPVAVVNSTFSGNAVSLSFGNGGAIAHLGGDLTIRGSHFNNNTAPDGGALFVAAGATAKIADSTFSTNQGGYGSAIESSGSSLRIRDSVFTGNLATVGDGGAIWLLAGVVDIDRSQFQNNQSNSTGGAISCYGDSLMINNSTFTGNQASGQGGALYSGCGMLVRNSTFHANSTVGTHGGGAISQTGAPSGLVLFSTISQNTAAFGAGLYGNGSSGGTFFVGQSILSANSGGNCDGVVGSNGYNLSSDTNCGGFVQTGDAQNVSLPLLGLGNFGGPTLTRPPGAGNVAINRIPPASCFVSYDQRGGVRPAGGACDSGAVEINAIIDRIFLDGFDSF